jgi:integrase/recombinase XerD
VFQISDQTMPLIISELRKSQITWLDAHRERGHSSKTTEVYGQCLAQLERFLTVRHRERPADIAPQDLEMWRTHLVQAGLKAASISVYVRAARGWLHWLSERGEIFLDPAAELRSPRIPRSLSKVPTVAEMATLMGSVDTGCAVGVRDRAILETAYATALRRHELANMAVDDVDLNHRVARTLGKGGRERMVPLTQTAAAWLRRYLAEAREGLRKGREEVALWLNRRGHPLAAESLARMIQARSRAAGLRAMTPHVLRRACATHLLENGARPAELRQLLGHASFKHLDQYLRLGFRDLQTMHRKSRVGQ